MATKQNSTKQKLTLALFALSIVLMIFGILFMLTAAELVPIFKVLYKISNILGRYVVVILTMASGIMLFSNLAATLPDKKKRNTLTIIITIFSTILTVPLVYVFVAIFFAENGIIGVVGEIMMLENIIIGFKSLFGSGGIIYAVYSFMLILSIVFITVPLLTGVLTLKGKAIKIGKQASKKFGIGVSELPIISKQNNQSK